MRHFMTYDDSTGINEAIEAQPPKIMVCLIYDTYLRRDFFVNAFVDTFGAPLEADFFPPLAVTPFGVKSDRADSSILYRILPRSIWTTIPRNCSVRLQISS